MEVVQQWTGRSACALQAALRMTNEGFASHLGVAVRTVAAWHGGPDLIPRAEMQQLLDTTLEQSADAVRKRFSLLIRDIPQGERAEQTTEAQALRVAIAVVLRDGEVLLVCRRNDDADGINW